MHFGRWALDFGVGGLDLGCWIYNLGLGRRASDLGLWLLTLDFGFWIVFFELWVKVSTQSKVLGL